LANSLEQSATQVVTSVITLIGILIMMFSINVTMTIASLIILPISIILIGFVASKSQKYFKRQQDYLGHVNGEIEEMFSGHNVVKAFNAENKMINNFEKENTNSVSLWYNLSDQTKIHTKRDEFVCIAYYTLKIPFLTDCFYIFRIILLMLPNLPPETCSCWLSPF